jgi:hypothetical protein
LVAYRAHSDEIVMPKRSHILHRIALAYAAVAFVALLEAVALDFEIFGATLLLSLATLPSIVAYALCEQLAPACTKLRHALFLAPVVLIAGLCLAAQIAPSAYFDVPALYRWILLGYLLQIAPAFLVLILSRLRQN